VPIASVLQPVRVLPAPFPDDSSADPTPETPLDSAPLGDRAVSEADIRLRAVSEADIRLRAYYRWEDAGRPAGDGVVFWLEAERELREDR
jgi:hypothetical protein